SRRSTPCRSRSIWARSAGSTSHPPGSCSASAGSSSWAAWPQRSRAAAEAGSAAVVRRLHDHLDVVRVRLLEPGRRDANELALLAQLVDCASTDVEHRLPQSA